MDDDQTIPPPVRIPSAWRAFPALQEALEVLANNPDLMGEDIKIALKSEAPKAVDFLNAMIASCQHLRYQAGGSHAHAKRLAERAKLATERWERQKLLTAQVMKQLGVNHYDSPEGPTRWNDSDGPVYIPDEDAVPDAFIRTKTVRSPDKIAIGKYLDAGNKVPWASRGNGTVSLTIKG